MLSIERVIFSSPHDVVPRQEKKKQHGELFLGRFSEKYFNK